MKICLNLKDFFVQYWLDNKSIFGEFKIGDYITKDDENELIEKSKIYFSKNAHERSYQTVLEATINGEAIHYYISRKYPNIWVPTQSENNKFIDLIWNNYSIEIKSFTEYYSNPDWTKKSFSNICSNIKKIKEYEQPEYIMVFARTVSYGSNAIVNVNSISNIEYFLCCIIDYNTLQPVLFNETLMQRLGIFYIFSSQFGEINV